MPRRRQSRSRLRRRRPSNRKQRPKALLHLSLISRCQHAHLPTNDRSRNGDHSVKPQRGTYVQPSGSEVRGPLRQQHIGGLKCCGNRAGDEGEHHMPMRADSVSEADGRANLLPREVVEGERNQDNSKAHRGKVLRLPRCKCPRQGRLGRRKHRWPSSHATKYLPRRDLTPKSQATRSQSATHAWADRMVHQG